MNKIKLVNDTIDTNDLEKLTDWIKTNPRLTKGDMTIEFEKKWSEWLGCKYSVYLNSGSSANLAMVYSLMISGRLKNKKIILPAVSWTTTVTPSIHLGLEPILCESDKETLGVDIEHLEHLFVTHNPSALMIVHVLAFPNKMKEIAELCKKYDVILIEDSCESIGSTYDGVKTGNFGLMSSFSFYYGHHISTIEGGAVTTNDTKLYNLMLSIRSHGWSRDVDQSYKESWKEEFNIDSVREYYTFYYPGFNLRSTDLNAFIGISQLDKMKEICKVREENYNFYNKYLENKFWKQESEYSELSSFAYGTIVENREEVFNHLKANNIEVRPLICGSMGKQPFWIKKYGQTSLEVADIIHDYGLYLPNHFYLDEEKIKFVCEKFKQVAIPKFF